MRNERLISSDQSGIYCQIIWSAGEIIVFVCLKNGCEFNKTISFISISIWGIPIVGYFIVCVHIAKFIIYSTMYIFKIACTQKLAILNTGYAVALHDKYVNTYDQWPMLVLYYTVIIILIYNFNPLIWLTGLVEVVSACSCQPKLIGLTCSKKIINY